MNSDAGSGINGSGSGDEEKGNEKQVKIFYHQRTWTETNTYQEDLILVDKEIYKMLVDALKEAYKQEYIYYDEEKDGLYVGARNTLFFKVKPIECENEEKEG